MLVAQSVTYDLIRSLRTVVAQVRVHNTTLADQITRAANSVAANLAEGTRRTNADKKRVYRLAAAEAQEVRAAIESIAAWGYLPDDALAPARALADRLGALTFGLAR